MISDASALPPTGQADAPTSTDSRTAELFTDAASATGVTSATDKPASNNLQDDPNFRKLQSQYTKQIEDLRKAKAELESRLEETELADMDDVDRLKYERDKFARQLEEREQREVIEQDRRRVLSELSNDYGVPVEAMEDAKDPYEAARLAADYLKRNGPERREASKVDLGGGRANTPADRIETAVREAFANRDPAAYIRLLREAQG